MSMYKRNQTILADIVKELQKSGGQKMEDGETLVHEHDMPAARILYSSFSNSPILSIIACSFKQSTAPMIT